MPRYSATTIVCADATFAETSATTAFLSFRLRPTVQPPKMMQRQHALHRFEQRRPKFRSNTERIHSRSGTTKLARVHHLRWALGVAPLPFNLCLPAASAQRSLIVWLLLLATSPKIRPGFHR